MSTDYFKYCPKCNEKMFYTTKKGLKAAINRNSICKECKKLETLKNKINFRICPKCNKKIMYKGYITIEQAEKFTNERKLCRSCISAEVMRGKSVYDVWLEKYGKEIADIKMKECKNKLSENFKGEKNPNYKNKLNGNKGLLKFSKKCKGKTFEEIYGKEKALKIKQKISDKTSGENNAMFGKPAPKRSGNGWSGYYKSHYFRSMLELYYLIYLTDNNINFESGEKRKHAISYVMDNLERNYLPTSGIPEK